MRLIGAQGMKKIDEIAIEREGIPSLQLMENAADGIVATIEELAGNLSGISAAVFCGSGNNGGDGVCAAVKLSERGAAVRVFLVGRRDRFTPDMAEMVRRFETAGKSVEDFSDDAREYTRSCEYIIDAMFGVGLNSPLREPASSACRLINSCSAKVIAADIASGISADTGEELGRAVRADVTVTFSMAKPGHFVGRGGECCGRLIVHDIGIPEELCDEEESSIFAVDAETADDILPYRRRDSHKGDYGKLLLICGSVGYTGAAYMAAQAAVRSGAGLVSLGVPEAVYPILAAKLSEVMVFPLPCTAEGCLSMGAYPKIMEKLEKSDVCLIGPGLGSGAETARLIRRTVRHAQIPVVLDADGINAFKENIDILKDRAVILTPHEGEFKRIGGDTEKGRLAAAAEFAGLNGCILTLKGYRTITAAPDGGIYINTTGNPGMATGGSGDVLAGVITALLGQGLAPVEAAYTGVFIHGLAGDMCAERLGEYGMLPTDMIEELPKVFHQFR